MCLPRIHKGQFTLNTYACTHCTTPKNPLFIVHVHCTDNLPVHTLSIYISIYIYLSQSDRQTYYTTFARHRPFNYFRVPSAVYRSPAEQPCQGWPFHFTYILPQLRMVHSEHIIDNFLIFISYFLPHSTHTYTTDIYLLCLLFLSELCSYFAFLL